MTVQDVLAAAGQLSQEERLQVAIRLLESLREFHSLPPKEPDSDSSGKPKLNSLVESLVGAFPSEKQDFPGLPSDNSEEKFSLHDLLSQSPLSRLDFEAEAIQSPVRAVEF